MKRKSSSADDLTVTTDSSPSSFSIVRHYENMFRLAQGNAPGLKRNTHHCFEIQNAEKEIVGGSHVVRYLDLLSIESFWVAGEQQGQDVGHKLYSEIEEFGRAHGCKFIVGTVPSSFGGALHFWEKQGGAIFATLGEPNDSEKIYYVRKKIR